MPYAVITIDKIDKNDGNYMHFKDKSQKAWNCNKPELIASMVEGERYKIDYNETEPKGGRKYGSKYINRARFWEENDGPNTWPDKEAYTGGGGSGSTFSGPKGGSVKKDYDPEVSKRQTAANCAMSYLSNAGVTVEELSTHFPTVAGIVMEYLNGAPKSDTGASDSGSSEVAASDEDFGF